MKLNIFDYGDSLLFEVKTYPVEPFEEKPNEPQDVDEVILEIYKNNERQYRQQMTKHPEKDGKYSINVNTYDELEGFENFKIQIIAKYEDAKQVLTDYIKLRETYNIPDE